MNPSIKLEYSLKIMVKPPVIKPYIHWPGFVFAPVIGSVTTNTHPKRNDPETRAYRNDGADDKPVRLNVTEIPVPPRRHANASLHDAAFLYMMKIPPRMMRIADVSPREPAQFPSIRSRRCGLILFLNSINGVAPVTASKGEAQKPNPAAPFQKGTTQLFVMGVGKAI